MTNEHFFSPDRLGFVRVAVVSPELRVADVAFNTQKIIDAMTVAARQGVRLALFPELCITAYSCADLFFQPLLLEQALAALATLAEATASADIAVVVGLPLAVEGKLYIEPETVKKAMDGIALKVIEGWLRQEQARIKATQG